MSGLLTLIMVVIVIILGLILATVHIIHDHMHDLFAMVEEHYKFKE